ncbi:hypothetical protein E1B28_011811 [Marasmius oreades]|uniref:Isochorismatase-like domain-containing protein n=1 Tax=Marasmius oreades TaxID=181124 RepID=A0A9P7RWB2_9AGAR|nr:uncharacterized protein E1B28_011811 [Marasmius oreades]KAG7090208.1 hypothetical protein E1B28_011811 [Marasmius oreades]
MPTAILPSDGLTTNGTSNSFSTSTTPPCISSSRHVLLLLDVQKCNLSDQTGVPNAPNLRDNILQVLKQARESQPPPLIIHVRNIGDVGEPDEYGSEPWGLMFPALDGEWVIDKRKNNAFAGTNLGEWVRDDAEIVVVGVMSDYSIRATCSAALGRGNEVLLIRDAHGTYDRVEVLYGGGVTPAHNIETEIEEELEEAGVHVLEMKDIPGIFTDR